ncbi:hypothetical protein K3495_g6168 [Podosphaera aphanis]|nr:hypothetical protein K3495_g6168 [Podosphaera aphanis]
MTSLIRSSSTQEAHENTQLPKRRKQITNEQKRALRMYAKSEVPPPSQKDCMLWFEQRYAHKLSKSTTSDILGNRYSHLDAIPSSEVLSLAKNRRRGWPALDESLWEWVQLYRAQGNTLTDEVLKNKAKELWQCLYDKNATKPSFSDSWIYRFKVLKNINKTSLHVKTVCTVVDEDASNTTAEIKETAAETDSEEATSTGMRPEKTSVSETLGSERDTTRACNATEKEIPSPVEKISHQEASKLLERFQLYEAQQDHVDERICQLLKYYQKIISRRVERSKS